jgi:hypothetical protein
MVTMGILPYQGKIPMVEPGIEPGTTWLVCWLLDHKAGHWLYIWAPVYMHTRESSWNLHSSTVELDRQQQNCLTTIPITQQYSFAIFLFELSCPEGKIWHSFQKCYFRFYSFYKITQGWKCVSQGMCVFSRLYSAAPDVYVALCHKAQWTFKNSYSHLLWRRVL